MFTSQWWNSRGILQCYCINFTMALSQVLATEVSLAVSSELNLVVVGNQTKALEKTRSYYSFFQSNFSGRSVLKVNVLHVLFSSRVG